MFGRGSFGIDELGHAFGRDQDIARFQVPVDDGVLVSNVNRSADLAEELEPSWDIQPAIVAIFVDPLTFDVLRFTAKASRSVPGSSVEVALADASRNR